MKGTVERQWPEEIEEHLLAVVRAQHRCKETTQPDGGKEKKDSAEATTHC